MERLDLLQKSLAATAVPRAKTIARHYAEKRPEHAADIESAACWGALQAASAYEHEKSGRWQRWSGLYINMAVREFLQSAWAQRHRQIDEEDFESLVASDSSVEGREEKIPERLLRGLPPSHRRLCLLIYEQSLSPAEAGEKLGMNPERAWKIHSEAIHKMRDNHEHSRPACRSPDQASPDLRRDRGVHVEDARSPLVPHPCLDGT